MANQAYPSASLRSGITLNERDSETIVVKSRKTIAVYDAVGGPERVFGSGEYAGGPTSPGEYIIVKIQKHVSEKWIFSRIAWGTPMNDDGKEITVLVKGIWKNQEQITGLPREEILTRYHEISQHGTHSKIPESQWIFNDFGHITCYFSRDINKNGLHELNEPIYNQMFHTTPENEYQTIHGLEVKLEPSHGCIHLKPKDIDEMIQKGYLNSGNVIYIYDYALQPFSTTKVEPGNPPYSVNFFPGIKKVFIKGI